jgi:ligand-binding sensor domain-containing protein
MWFATSDGISCYDGSTWITYTTANGLVSNYVNSAFKDRAGNLWFGTAEGVNCFNGTTWTTYTTDDGVVSRGVGEITQDSAGNIWVAAMGGVSRFDGTSWTTYRTADGLAENNVQSVLAGSNGYMWFGTYGSGVSRFDGFTWTTYTTADGLVDDAVWAIAEDRFGNLWFGTSRGVSRFDGSSWARYTTTDGLVNNAVLSLTEQSSGHLWFGTQGGGSCFDGADWVTYTTSEGLPNRYVHAITEDSNGDLWFGTVDGVGRYDGVTWATYNADSGLAHNSVYAITEDSDGHLWFGTWDGVSRYDGVTWTTYNADSGLAQNWVNAIVQDSRGDLWFGTMYGVSRYDGATWTTYKKGYGLADNQVRAIVEDRSGNLWFGTWNGVSCFDGTGWTSYGTADGLADSNVYWICEDHYGGLWAGTWNGVSRYNGVIWTTYTTADGLVDNLVTQVIEAGNGTIWFATYGGVSAHVPDRIPPETVIWPEPKKVTASRNQTITFTAAFKETWGNTFSHSLDGGHWSGWLSTGVWMGSGLADGEHIFEVRARDRAGNVDFTPAIFTFEIDATPPAPVIASPAFGEAVRGTVTVYGTAADMRFRNYSLDVGPAGSGLGNTLVTSSSPVSDGVLGVWNSRLVADGGYDLRLSVADTLGLTSTALVTVTVDNLAPWAWETTPAPVSGSTGGDVYTAGGAIHIYFAPRSFARDVTVEINPAEEWEIPDSLDNGARLVFPGYVISWERVEIETPAVLTMRLNGAASNRDCGRVLSMYVRPEKQPWERLGGTLTADGGYVTVPITCEGVYALFCDSGDAGGGDGLSELSLIPRILSTTSPLGNEEITIAFSLSRPAEATVSIYNRAGRMVARPAEGVRMNSGVNVVHWKGRDTGGDEVPDGLYLVTVEALGETRVKTLAVAR